MQCRLELVNFVVFILFVAVFVPITIQVYDYYINRKEGFFMLLETIFASSLLLATDETTHFTKRTRRAGRPYYNARTIYCAGTTNDSSSLCVLQIKTGCSKTNLLQKKMDSEECLR
jgi:hypothetical protein